MRNIESVGELTTGRGLHKTTRVVWLSSANYNPLSINREEALLDKFEMDA